MTSVVRQRCPRCPVIFKFDKFKTHLEIFTKRIFSGVFRPFSSQKVILWVTESRVQLSAVLFRNLSCLWIFAKRALASLPKASLSVLRGWSLTNAISPARRLQMQGVSNLPQHEASWNGRSWCCFSDRKFKMFFPAAQLFGSSKLWREGSFSHSLQTTSFIEMSLQVGQQLLHHLHHVLNEKKKKNMSTKPKKAKMPVLRSQPLQFFRPAHLEKLPGNIEVTQSQGKSFMSSGWLFGTGHLKVQMKISSFMWVYLWTTRHDASC